jgi:hypothetical protein
MAVEPYEDRGHEQDESQPPGGPLASGAQSRGGDDAHRGEEERDRVRRRRPEPEGAKSEPGAEPAGGGGDAPSGIGARRLCLIGSRSRHDIVSRWWPIVTLEYTRTCRADTSLEFPAPNRSGAVG